MNDIKNIPEEIIEAKEKIEATMRENDEREMWDYFKARLRVVINSLHFIQQLSGEETIRFDTLYGMLESLLTIEVEPEEDDEEDTGEISPYFTMDEDDAVVPVPLKGKQLTLEETLLEDQKVD